MVDRSLDQAKVAAVGEWLKEKFAGDTVSDTFDASRGGQFYRIADGAKLRHRVWVSEEFIGDHTAEEIVGLLDGWRVDDTIRAAGVKRVVVTNLGAGIEPEVTP